MTRGDGKGVFRLDGTLHGACTAARPRNPVVLRRNHVLLPSNDRLPRSATTLYDRNKSLAELENALSPRNDMARRL
jgi:hypothetical protein